LTSHAPFLLACRGEPVPYTPVWFMRQAGRYQPEYRALRERHAMLELLRTPELAAEVTKLPLALGVDAAIVFSDILLPFEPLGLGLRFVDGKGPVIDTPVRSAADVARLPPVTAAESLGFVGDAVRLVAADCGDTPVIGFSGAPFTLAAYAIEGGTSRDHVLTKQFMYREPAAWHALLDRLTEIAVDLLTLQVRAGAAALQVFDSWVGELTPDNYRTYVLPHTRRLFHRLVPLGVPLIYFGVATGSLLELMKEAGATVIGLGWRIPLDEARRRLGRTMPVQGNLDPAALFAPPAELRRQVLAILAANGGRPGHVFNTGHGIFPGTPVDHVRLVVDLVHEAGVSA